MEQQLNLIFTSSSFPFELESTWKSILADELAQPYLTDLAKFVMTERSGPIPIFPQQNQVFNAFFKTPFNQVKVVIVGQDPYHGPGQAHGLSFSVPRGIPQPPSLKNIFKELNADLGIKPPEHGCLISWAEQGVLLLNATLTVRQGDPMSHYGKGWERFTDSVIKALYLRSDPVIFVLWGKSAQEKCKQFSEGGMLGRHSLLTAAHPSPFSAHRGFFGCRHFSRINQLLVDRGEAPIDYTMQG